MRLSSLREGRANSLAWGYNLTRGLLASRPPPPGGAEQIASRTRGYFALCGFFVCFPIFFAYNPAISNASFFQICTLAVMILNDISLIQEKSQVLHAQLVLQHYHSSSQLLSLVAAQIQLINLIITLLASSHNVAVNELTSPLNFPKQSYFSIFSLTSFLICYLVFFTLLAVAPELKGFKIFMPPLY